MIWRQFFLSFDKFTFQVLFTLHHKVRISDFYSIWKISNKCSFENHLIILSIVYLIPPPYSIQLQLSPSWNIHKLDTFNLFIGGFPGNWPVAIFSSWLPGGHLSQLYLNIYNTDTLIFKIKCHWSLFHRSSQGLFNTSAIFHSTSV